MNTNFNGLWFNPTGIELESTVSVADALSTRSLIGHYFVEVQVYLVLLQTVTGRSSSFCMCQ